MNNIRQGILNRNVQQYRGRNETSGDIQYQNEQKTLQQKTDSLQSIYEHRRIAHDGAKTEKYQLKEAVKNEIDTLLGAKQKCEQDRQLFEKQEHQKNQQYINYLNSKMDRNEQARRDYQKNIMNMNIQLVQQKVETQKNEKITGYQQDIVNHEHNFWKKSTQY